MKYLIIFNPGSKGGKNSKKIERIKAIFEKNRINYDIKITRTLSDAYEISRWGNENGYDAIIAAGGDGTINRALNGFFDKDGRRVSNAKFGVIYTGTSPDFCKSYNIPIKIEDAAKAIIKGKTVMIDIGKITMREEYSMEYDGRPVDMADKAFVTNYFGCCANIGLGAALARKANCGIRKYMGDFLGTFISLIMTLFEYRAYEFIVKSNGRITKIDEMFNLSVGITKYIASGIKVKNNRLPSDKRFYTLAVKNVRLSNVSGIVMAVYSWKEILESENLSLGYSEEIEVYGNGINNEIEFDGDPYGFLPCRIKMAEEKLELIVAVGEKNGK